MGQPNLTYFEPAFADEVALTMAYALDHMQKPDGSSVYLRLSTRTIAQVERADDDWEEDALKGVTGCANPIPMPRSRSYLQAQSRLKRWLRGSNWPRMCQVLACSTSLHLTCCIAVGRPKGQRAGLEA